MIDVCNISKHYGKFVALDSISFSLKNAEISAFLGLNGAGKTSLMNILAGVTASTVGSILYDGVNISIDPIRIKSKLGYLLENNPLYGDMYVNEYLEYVCGFYMKKKEIKECCDFAIEKLGLSQEYKKQIKQLSFGNKKKVGLAQAIIHNPEILILDEPTNGLDPDQCQNIKELIKDLGKTKTILYSSHRFEDIQDIADRYLILNKGKLVYDDTALNTQSIQETFFKLAL